MLCQKKAVVHVNVIRALSPKSYKSFFLTEFYTRILIDYVKRFKTKTKKYICFFLILWLADSSNGHTQKIYDVEKKNDVVCKSGWTA